jgi:hypothetical protein
MNKGLWVVLSVSLLAQRAHAQDSGVPAPAGRFVLEVEAGPVWQSRNDVQIPNESGTRISLVDLIGAGPNPAYRVSGIWEISRRHSLRVLVAPLTISGDGVLNAPVEFAGSSFLQDVTTEATYRFNSYRLTYRYRLSDGARWSWQLGFTAKIRDAKVELRQPDAAARDYNIGFVPLLHFTGRLQLMPRWQLQGEVDALAAPQGRAEDAALKLSYSPSDAWSLAIGYRTLEGGADVDEVFTFAWLHYGVLSVRFRF